MKNVLRSALACLAASLAFSLAAPKAAAAGGPLLEKEIEVPRATRVPLDMTWEKCALLDVETQNDPGDKAVQAAKDRDPKDLTFLLVRFRYRNTDWIDHRVRLRAVLLDAAGNVLADNGRTGTMDKNQTDDTLSFPMKVKTVDWPNAAKMKVTASFLK
ncbi:MAG TPA: hypothetical protein VKS23_06200 [Thermoanaerobaculia bacterium]|jgi:hypothetical protein|nr:hypothetical protein [Thermoanaerobaculia bacterium]